MFVLSAMLLFAVGAQQSPEKPSYRVGKITVEGAASLSNKQVTRIMSLRNRASADAIEETRRRLIRAYRNYGRIQASVEIDAHKVAGGHVQEKYDLVVRIAEGPVFVLRRLEFMGNAQTGDRVIRHRILLQEGQPYSDELLEKSVRNLNGLGRFERVSAGNMEIKADDSKHVVDLLIHLTERPGLKLRRE